MHGTRTTTTDGRTASPDTGATLGERTDAAADAVPTNRTRTTGTVESPPNRATTVASATATAGTSADASEVSADG